MQNKDWTLSTHAAPADYTVTSVKPAFKGEIDDRGNATWSVSFEGDQESALLKTKPKNEPKAGDVLYGHFEGTKKEKETWKDVKQNARGTWFRKDRKDGFSPRQYSAPQSAPQAAPQTNDRDARIVDQVIYKGAIEIYRWGELSVDDCVARAVQIMDAVKARHNAPQPAAAEVEDNVPF